LVAAQLLLSSAMIKLITGFGDYSDDDLAILGHNVADKLPTLPIFATLKPEPAAIEAAATALDAAIAMVGPGRAQAIRAAFAKLATLLGEISVNAPQVTGVTDTDLAMIGIPQTKTPVRETEPPGPCENLRLRNNGMPGEIRGRCESLGENIRLYEVQWTLDPNGTDWSDPIGFPNSRSFKLAGLTRGKDVWVRARARNTIGVGPWGDPATIMVT
jgi:hypothetical protein